MVASWHRSRGDSHCVASCSWLLFSDRDWFRSFAGGPSLYGARSRLRSLLLPLSASPAHTEVDQLGFHSTCAVLGARRWRALLASLHLSRMTTRPNHGAAANGLSAVRSMDGHILWRRVRPIGGHAAVADLIR